MRKMGPLPADHHAVGQVFCSRCGFCFKTGDYVTLVQIGAADEEEAEKEKAGRPFTALAAIVHWECVPEQIRGEP